MTSKLPQPGSHLDPRVNPPAPHVGAKGPGSPGVHDFSGGIHEGLTFEQMALQLSISTVSTMKAGLIAMGRELDKRLARLDEIADFEPEKKGKKDGK